VTATTLADALRSALAHDAARPFITWLGPDGARVELSVRTFENNVAKAANLLQDEAGVSRGSRAVLRIAPHWQSLVWLCACAVTSTVAWLDGDESDPRVDIAVVGPNALDGEHPAPLTLATSLHPLGMPFAGPLPAGVVDAAVEVRAHGDRFTADDPPQPDTLWAVDGVRELTHLSALGEATERARAAGVAIGGRVLVIAGAHHTSIDLAVLAVALPLALDAGVVLLTDTTVDPHAAATSERCNAVIQL
jgi:uncharacterized protein (TIGR03089 family)